MAAPHGGAQRVGNLRDPDAFTPLVAHTEHWNSRLLAHVLAEAVCDRLADVATLTRRVEEIRHGDSARRAPAVSPA